MKILLFLLILCFTLKSKCQPIPAQFKSSVVFIYFEKPSGEPVPDGTGFFVGKRLEQDTSKYFIFVATAKHVIINPDGTFADHILYRLNVKDSTRYVVVPLKYNGKDKNVFFHTDTTVDLVLIAGLPSKKDYEYKFITEDLFIKRNEAQNILEGTEAFFVGLFVNHIGDKHNFPIFRFGHVAISTNEKVSFLNVKREMAIIETNTYGGNSGSPIFYKIYNDAYNWNIKLGGLVNGYFGTYLPFQTISTNYQVYASSNVGIAAVTPSYFIEDILQQKDVKDFFEINK